MIGTLYLITNNINGKKYVGKTYKKVDSRWKDHVSKANSGSNRPICRAIRKYGPEQFTIEPIGYYPEGVLEDKEISTIAVYNSYSNGYNATKGGGGKRYVDDALILSCYNDKRSVRTVSDITKYDCDTIKRVLNASGIDTDPKQVSIPKGVVLECTGEVFDSATDCARYLIDIGILNTSVDTARSSISKCANGLLSSYKGLTFKRKGIINGTVSA